MALQKAKPMFRLRKIDVVSWDSPVAEQFELQSLPALMLYAGTELWSADNGEIIDMLNSL